MQKQMLARQIKVDDDVYEELTDLGKKNETYNDIIRRILDVYKRNIKK